MDSNDKSGFHKVSIQGRYIYGYLCLMQALRFKKLEGIPMILDEVMIEFISLDQLDAWQDRADEMLPSIILNEENDRQYYQIISLEVVYGLRGYYKRVPSIINLLIEEIIGLGLANLYVGFNTSITFPYIEKIISLLNDSAIPLPDFHVVENCSVNEFHGWGNPTSISIYLDKWHEDVTLWNIEEQIRFYLKDLVLSDMVVSESTIVGIQNELDFRLPEDYVELVRKYSDSEGGVGEDSWIRIYSFYEIIEVNRDYRLLMDQIPDYYLFGKDSADTGYAFHKQNHTYHSFGLMSNFKTDTIEHCGGSLVVFLKYLYDYKYKGE